MTGLNHGITGAVIAVTINNPVLAIPIAFASHFVQDAIPHWNYSVGPRQNKIFSRRFNTFLIADFVLSLVLMAFLGGLFPEQMWLVWVCMAAAAAPDLMWAYYRLYIEYYKKQKPAYDPLARFHNSLQWSQTRNGAYIEIAWFVLFSLIIIKLR